MLEKGLELTQTHIPGGPCRKAESELGVARRTDIPEEGLRAGRPLECRLPRRAVKGGLDGQPPREVEQVIADGVGDAADALACLRSARTQLSGFCG